MSNTWQCCKNIQSIKHSLELKRRDNALEDWEKRLLENLNPENGHKKVEIETRIESLEEIDRLIRIPTEGR